LKHKLANIRLEKNVIKESEFVLTTNRRVKELILSRYRNIEYNDVVIIPHGYDSMDFEKAAENPVPKTDKMRITYSGSFYTRDPLYYFDSIKLLFQKHPELKDKIEFCFIGNLPKDLKQVIIDYGIQDNINVLGYLEHIDCSDILNILIV